MKKAIKTIIFGLIIGLFLLLLNGCSGNVSDVSNEFSQCLTDNGAVMYGTEWCSHCQNQKAAFGSAFKNINFVDCDKNQGECLKAGVQGYPTWMIDGESYSGEQPLEKLAGLTDCELK